MRSSSVNGKKLAAAAAVLAIGICTGVTAESDDAHDLFDLSLEELIEVSYTVESASKYEQTSMDAPAFVTVVTAEKIRLYGYRTLLDIIRSVPGMYVGNDRNYGYVGIRGFRRSGDYDSRILLLVDGYRINENIADSPAWVGEFPVDVDLIKRVEVIRGPGSALYGSNALLGVINVITKDAKDVTGAELSGEAGSFDTMKGRATYGQAFSEDIDVLASATTFDSDGDELYYKEFDDASTNNGKVDNDDEQWYNLFFRANAGEFSFIGAHVAREKGIPTAPWGTIFADPDTRTNDDRTILGLKYAHSMSEELSVIGRASYHHYNYDGTYAYDDDGKYINYDYWKGRWWEGEMQFIAEPHEKHKLTWGAEGRYNVRQAQKNWDWDVYLDDDRHSKNWGLYIQDEFKAFDKVTVIGGVRYDYYDFSGSSTNPRLAVLYRHRPDTVVKFLAGTAFRAPNAYELYYNDGDYTTKAAHDLDPETIRTYEVVLEKELDRMTHASASGFYYSMKDLIEQEIDAGDGLLVFTNHDEVKAKGVEIALDKRWEGGLMARASYSFVQAEDANGDWLVNSPKHLAKLNVIAPIIDRKVFAGVELFYSSEALTKSGARADDFVLTNLNLTWANIVEGLEFSAGIYNVFDVTYDSPAFSEHVQDVIRQDGRTFRLKLTYRF